MARRIQPENYKNKLAERRKDPEVGQPLRTAVAGPGMCPLPGGEADLTFPGAQISKSPFPTHIPHGKADFSPFFSPAGRPKLCFPGHSSCSSWPCIPREPREPQQDTNTLWKSLFQREFLLSWHRQQTQRVRAAPAAPSVSPLSHPGKGGIWLPPFSTTGSAAAQSKPIV